MSMPNNENKHPISEWGKSLTRQSEAASADINLIMKKYDKTGILPPATRQGFFADVSSVGDYREAVERVEKADDMFMQFPAEIRSKFSNDPAEFLDFVSDPGNLPEIEEMGLIRKDGEAKPVEQPVVADPGPVSSGPEGAVEPPVE